MMTLLSLSADYRRSQKNSFKSNMRIPFRSYSHEQIVHSSNHRRSNSSQSVDLFTMVVPTNTDSSLSSLICSICSLPMIKPTLLPCQHTFCFKCIQNDQQIYSGSVPLCLNNYLSANDNQPRLITCHKCSHIHHVHSLTDLEINQSMELLINTLLCETCHQLYPSNQLDTCLHCYGVLCLKCYEDHVNNHQNELKTNTSLYRVISTDETINITMKAKPIETKQISNSQIFKSKSFNNEEKPLIESNKQIAEISNNGDENTDPSQNNTKKKSNGLFYKIMHSSRHRQSTTTSFKDPVPQSPSPPTVKKASSLKTSRRPKITIDIQIEDTSKTDSVQPIVPVTPVRRFLNLFDQYSHTAQHVKQCKQRQLQLDRSVSKLVEVLTTKTNENLNQISQYWMYLKQLSLSQFQSKPNRFIIFDYLLKTCCSTNDSQKQIEAYFEQNDEIKAALQVLSTTLTIVNNQQSLVTINHLFDREEQAIIRTLHRNLETLLLSYADELSFIIERINVYETRFATWKNSSTTDLDSITYEWTQIIEHDYPSLIEKISNDFITKIPHIEKNLVQMLKNMKKRLLNVDNQPTIKRTSVC